MLFDLSKVDRYFYATRVILCNQYRATFGIFSGPNIIGTGSEGPDYSSLNEKRGLRPIVTIPQDRIDLSVGNGVKGNEWGIK